MPISIRRSAEPLSEDSLGNGRSDRDVVTVKSEAGRVLLHELQRYCRGEILGRSFLIAGHRGAGKTTTVHDVLLRVIKESQGQGSRLLRPLPVLLHGPSLFMALSSDSTKPVDASPSATALSVPTAAASSVGGSPAPLAPHSPDLVSTRSSSTLGDGTDLEAQAEVALKQVVLGLHRATAKEFSRAYRRYLRSKIEDARRGAAETPAVQGWVRELGELAAQFEIELLEDPPASRLREFWDHAGALAGGVLRTNIDAPDLGARELVALNGICNAHQRVSGELSAQQKNIDSKKIEEEFKRGLELKGADAFKPLVALLSGSVVAAGAVAGTQSMLKAAAAGLAVTWLSSVFVQSSNLQSRKRERTVDTTFIPDLSLRTLDRILPTLLERLREAGLAPVFVVDELDKINLLPERIVAIVHFLKKLVAETVFTCFLTDRGYLEYLRVNGEKNAYSFTYSYFSLPLLVAYDPADLHRYLNELLVVPGDADEADRLDLEVMAWVLRHRSQMHALELMRVIGMWRNASGQLELGQGVVRTSTIYRIDATCQVAIEHQLAQQSTTSWKLQRPGLRHALIDAAYDISRAWLRGDEEIDLSSQGRQAFAERLRVRMNLRDMTRQTEASSDGAPPTFSDDDLDALMSCAAGVASTLCDFGDITSFEASWPRRPAVGSQEQAPPRPTQTVLELLLKGEESVLHREPGDPELLFRFRYKPSGERRAASTTRMPRTAQGIGKLARLYIEPVREYEDSLWKLLRRSVDPERPDGAAFRILADECRVLPTSPAWNQVRIAGFRLDQARHGLGNVPELLDDLASVRQFHAMLATHAPELEPLLQLSALLGGVHGDEEPASAVRFGLQVLSEALGFSRMGTAAVLSRVRDMSEALEHRMKVTLPAARRHVSSVGGSLSLLPLDIEVQGRIQYSVTLGRQFSSTDVWKALSADAWSDLERRFALPVSDVPAAPDAAGMLCAARQTGPAAFLPMSQFPLTLRDWTRLLAAGLALDPTSEDDSRMPAGVIGESLKRLGAGNLDSGLRARLLDAIQELRGGSDAERTRIHEMIPLANAAHGENAVALLVSRGADSDALHWTALPTRGMAFVFLPDTELKRSLGVLAPLLAKLFSRVPLLVEDPNQWASAGVVQTDALGQLPANINTVNVDPREWTLTAAPDGADKLLAFVTSTGNRLG